MYSCRPRVKYFTEDHAKKPLNETSLFAQGSKNILCVVLIHQQIRFVNEMFFSLVLYCIYEKKKLKSIVATAVTKSNNK